MEAQVIAGTPAGVADAALGDLLTRARSVASVAASHANDVDAAARFPAESFAAAKSQRLLGITVPKALGGEGAASATSPTSATTSASPAPRRA